MLVNPAFCNNRTAFLVRTGVKSRAYPKNLPYIPTNFPIIIVAVPRVVRSIPNPIVPIIAPNKPF